jgi:transposase
MLILETITKVRLAYFRDGKGIREIARKFNLARNTVKNIIRSGITDQEYKRSEQPRPKLGIFVKQLAEWLKEDSIKPVRHRRSSQILFEQLQREGYEGGYDTLRRYVGRWQEEDGSAIIKAFVPLEFDPGEAFQFDWSYEKIELDGVSVEINIAHFRLCYSRKLFCVAYTLEKLEMVFDAHIRAFEFFGGVCRRGIYDNLKAVVTKILMGKDRLWNRRFQSLASHYLFEPVACTPAAGWEKGQVENQVDLVRSRFFVLRRRFASLEELNEWLERECRNYAISAKHPEFKDKTVDQVFAEEKSKLLNLPVSPFDGYHEGIARVSLQLLVSFDRNRYSVDAMAVGKSVQVRAYADHVIIVLNDTVVATHKRCFGRDKVVYDPWHYLAVLERKPGALRNGTPFKRWELPDAISEIRTALEGRLGGDREFVNILSVVSRYGLESVAIACSQALSDKTLSSDIILSILSRTHDEPQPEPAILPEQLPLLKVISMVDCYRYDSLMKGGAYGTA